MIRLNVVQGTEAWAAARVGLPTASCFDKIITAVKAEFSTQSAGYAHQLIAEQILGAPLDNATSGFMQRGTILEQRAVTWYELENDIETEPVGFVLRDDRRVGCSPDRFVGEVGLLEIKCPAADTHVGYLLDDKGVGYRAQCQGQLWICEREWIDTLSYSPSMPNALVRQQRDEIFITKLAAAVDRFLNMVDDFKVRLERKGVVFDTPVPSLRVA